MNSNALINDPTMLVVDTTTRCNASCFFCWRRDQKEYLRNILTRYKQNSTIGFTLFKKIIDEAVCYNSLTDVSLCGPMGEPLTNKDFTTLTQYIYNQGHFKRITINTNGICINEHDPELLLNTTTEFSISIDSIKPETYKKIHGVPHLAVVLKNIRMLIAHKRKYDSLATIMVRFTENIHNIGEFSEFQKFFIGLGVDKINYTKVHAFAGALPEMVNSEGARSCNQLRTVNFNFLGEMTTCCVNWRLSPTFGNIAQYSLAEMWNGAEKAKWWQERMTSAPCQNCSGLGFHVQKTGLSYA